jgi:hypothetical protein
MGVRIFFFWFCHSYQIFKLSSFLNSKISEKLRFALETN